MKKVFSLICGLLLAACNQNSTRDIKGNEYILVNAPAGMEISLSFDEKDPKFYGQAVNRYFGNYELNENKIKFSAVGATMMAAPEPMMQAETEYFKNLDNVENISFENDNLVLSGKDTKLIFQEVAVE